MRAISGRLGLFMSVTKTRMEKGMADWLATGIRFSKTYWDTLFAGAYAVAGQTDKGLDIVNSAVDLYEKSLSIRIGPYLHWVKGEMLAKERKNTEEAEAEFRLALDLALRQENKYSELLAATSLARLWQGQDKKDEARELLSGIYGWFTEGFDTPVLMEAKVLLGG